MSKTYTFHVGHDIRSYVDHDITADNLDSAKDELEMTLTQDYEGENFSVIDVYRDGEELVGQGQYDINDIYGRLSYLNLDYMDFLLKAVESYSPESTQWKDVRENMIRRIEGEISNAEQAKKNRERILRKTEY